MKLDGDKLIAKLELVKSNYISDKRAANDLENYGDALMYHSAECNIEMIISTIRSGDYTIESDK